MIDNHFRSILPRFTKLLIKLYSSLKLTPNHVSLIGFFFACLSALLITQNMFIESIIIWWLGRIFDGTDGIYARTTNQTSLFGSHLDILLDMAAYSLMILAFSISFPKLNILWFMILFLYVLCITGALSLGSLMAEAKIENQDNRGLRMGAGLAEGGETGIAYTLFLLFPEYIKGLSIIWIIVLSMTVIFRMVLARKVLRN